MRVFDAKRLAFRRSWISGSDYMQLTLYFWTVLVPYMTTSMWMFRSEETEQFPVWWFVFCSNLCCWAKLTLELPVQWSTLEIYALELPSLQSPISMAAKIISVYLWATKCFCTFLSISDRRGVTSRNHQYCICEILRGRIIRCQYTSQTSSRNLRHAKFIVHNILNTRKKLSVWFINIFKSSLY